MPSLEEPTFASTANGANGEPDSMQTAPSLRSHLIKFPSMMSVGDEEEDDSGLSSMSSVFTLCNSAIGAGVLALPFAFSCAGAVGTFLMCAVLGGCEGFTLYVLSKFAERYQAANYSILVRRALGRKLSVSLSGIMMTYQFGSCTAYIIIVGDTFTALLAPHVAPGSPLADRRVIMAAITLFIVLPLCLPRSLSTLKWVSTAGVCGFIFTAICILIRGTHTVAERPEPRFQDVQLFFFDFKALFAIPIIVFGFNCHANVVTIFTELKRDPSVLIPSLPPTPADFAAMPLSIAPRPKTFKMIGMISVILSAVFVIMAGYLSVGFAGYLAYPTTVSSNVLNSFPPNDTLMQVARGLIGAVVVGHYPLNQHPARLALEDVEAYFFGWRNLHTAFTTFQTIVFVSGTLAVGILVKDLGSVLHLIGGTAACYIIFFLPGLLLINAAIVKESESSLNLVETGRVAAEAQGSGSLEEPLILADPNERGIKRVGLIYSPRKSWWAGVILVGLSITILIITLATTFFG